MTTVYTQHVVHCCVYLVAQCELNDCLIYSNARDVKVYTTHCLWTHCFGQLVIVLISLVVERRYLHYQSVSFVQGDHHHEYQAPHHIVSFADVPMIQSASGFLLHCSKSIRRMFHNDALS